MLAATCTSPGRNAAGHHGRWAFGIPAATVFSTRCTSRTSPSARRATTSAVTDAGHHLLDPRTGAPVNAVASVTVLAPSAMVADTLATAAFVLGPTDGIALLERHGVGGLIVTPALERFATGDMPGARHPILSPAMSLVSVRRFLRTPKGLALIAIGLLAIIATMGAGPRRVGPVLTAGIVVAMLIDAPILRWREGEWTFPSGALLTGLIIAMILSPYQPWYIAATTSAVAILSKYLFRVRTANVFNPAALALVATFYVFGAGHSWWGALPEIPPVALIALFAAGVFICYRVNKVPAVLAFLGVYYLLVTITAFVGDPARVADLYRAPDLHAALYFAFFMVTDPPTSPPSIATSSCSGLSSRWQATRRSN